MEQGGYSKTVLRESTDPRHLGDPGHGQVHPLQRGGLSLLLRSVLDMVQRVLYHYSSTQESFIGQETEEPGELYPSREHSRRDGQTRWYPKGEAG